MHEMEENPLADKDEEKSKNMIGTGENSSLLNAKKPTPKYSKGVAMSFGFKRRPNPMMTTKEPAITEPAHSTQQYQRDSNGNKEAGSDVPVKPQKIKDRNLHKSTTFQKPVGTTPRTARFGFQPSTDRTNKVYDVKSPSPVEFGGSSSQNASKSRLSSPAEEQNMTMIDRKAKPFIKNVPKIENAERRSRTRKDNNETRGVKNEIAGAPAQSGKFTFQSTRLAQPEAVRVIETKTAKTIANNNKRFARIRQQFEEASLKGEPLTGDSGFDSNTSAYSGEQEYSTNFRYSDNRFQHYLRASAHSTLENSDSLSENAGTPPPLPELPSLFRNTSPTGAKISDAHWSKNQFKQPKRSFLKLGSQKTFLKSRQNDSSPTNSCEPNWITAGEAMAEDTGLSVSPIQKAFEDEQEVEERRESVSTSVVEAVLQTLTKPMDAFGMMQSIKSSMSILEDDPSFTAVAESSTTGLLLDEEIFSPVESLLSCSETEEILKKKLTNSSSNSKDINEKLTPASPDTPTNGTYSLSLSDDKEDFLIDDEIADQPELVFEDTNADSIVARQFKQDVSCSVVKEAGWNQRAKLFEVDNSPLPERKRKDFLRSITGSIESLSDCDSIASDDLMMEYDISQTNDIDSCDRVSGSFSPLEESSRFILRTEDIVSSKPSYKSSFSKPLVTSRTSTPNFIRDSPRAIRKRLTHQTSPEHRSPKNSPLNQKNYHSVTYDSTSDCLLITKTNHSAIQQDIIGIKTMLLTLKRVLNESETQSTFIQDNYENGNFHNVNNNYNNNNNEFKVELADLKRQVLFLQGQLEDREKTVDNLQKQIDYLADQKTQNVDADSPPFPSANDQNRCNAATQTDRIRPLSTGPLTFSGSSMEDSGSSIRLLVK